MKARCRRPQCWYMIFTNIPSINFLYQSLPLTKWKKGVQYLQRKSCLFVKWNSQVSSCCTSMRWLTSVSQLLSAKVSHDWRAAKRWGVEIHSKCYSMLLMYSIRQYYTHLQLSCTTHFDNRKLQRGVNFRAGRFTTWPWLATTLSLCIA